MSIAASYAMVAHPTAARTSHEVAEQFAQAQLRVPTSFPAAFGGEKVAFAGALFGQMVVGLTAIATLIVVVRLIRTYRQNWRTPAQMHRIALACMMVGVAMFTLPGAVYNLLWGEVVTDALRHAQQVRIAGQFLAAVPWMLGLAAYTMAQPAITFQLEREPLPINLWATRRQLLQSALIGLGCLLLAIAVAVLKK